MRVRASVAVLMLLVACGCGRPPGAWRVRGDIGDGTLPRGRIHFVEHGRRATGVLLTTTLGGGPFTISWKYQLVPTVAGVLEGPVWTGRRASREQAIAIWNLPPYRDAERCIEYGDLPRFNYAERAVWILSTDPLIIGLPAGHPRRTWREYAQLATGGKGTDWTLPPHSYMTRYVLDEELDQPLDRLVVFPADFWATQGAREIPRAERTLITLPKPLAIDQALDGLVRKGSHPTIHDVFRDDVGPIPAPNLNAAAR